jgi:hypothetical protein
LEVLDDSDGWRGGWWINLWLSTNLLARRFRRRSWSMVLVLVLCLLDKDEGSAEARSCCCLPTKFCFSSTGGSIICLYLQRIDYLGTSINQFFEKGSTLHLRGHPRSFAQQAPAPRLFSRQNELHVQNLPKSRIQNSTLD